MKPKFLMLAIAILLALIILAQNTEVVVFRILFWNIAMSRIIFVFFMMLLGFVAGYATARFKGTKGSKKL
ncbi:MAG: LapA family protein [Deltaproteobacteria bacterium]|nr:LapA family protein [Deltaproteobacteria bacterium]